ncbi:acyl carrier protein [Actinoplanes sp. L3-i22]|uniref:acyl carrier protein n=1 Tax=Actinoplanes sp. L3-i22 TaxID=2836373 RepID=UPI001C752B6C|nr:acyl carrier protein [Actinoplanes sp. L3-i22]BCY13445.1 actinorhodin polyketide synthase acyl carrier protein [Actinoplanes sp. L3-i22]
MSDRVFAIDDLKRILSEGSGTPEGADLDADILDAQLSDLGYDSLALLETASRIEREYTIVVDETVLDATLTPRTLLELVNSQLKQHI